MSVMRKKELTALFEDANRRYNESRTALKLLIVYLHDVRKALSTDRTREGLASLKGSVFDVNERARRAQSAVAGLDALSARKASFRVQEVTK